jgi:hypothetical protein
MLPAARAEMFRAASWYERKSAGLGDRLLDDIRASLLVIQEFPLAFPNVDATSKEKVVRCLSLRADLSD